MATLVSVFYVRPKNISLTVSPGGPEFPHTKSIKNKLVNKELLML